MSDSTRTIEESSNLNFCSPFVCKYVPTVQQCYARLSVGISFKISNNYTTSIAALSFGTASICNTDYLEVYDAFSTSSRRLITRYCGNVRLSLHLFTFHGVVVFYPFPAHRTNNQNVKSAAKQVKHRAVSIS